MTAAYRRLGYASAGAGDATPTLKRVVVEAADGPFLSILDSDNAQLDGGVLKALAVALTKQLRTAALLASVHDSDSFALVVFDRGRQIDAVLSEPGESGTPLKVLSARQRATRWADLFLAPQLMQRLREQPGDAATQLTQIEAWQRDFAEQLRRAAATEGAFAEDGLAAWCAAVGLPAERTLAAFPDLVAEEAPGRTVLTFRELPAKPAAAPTRAAVALEPLLDADHCPYLRLYPAAWPIPLATPTGLQWLALTSTGGFSGLDLEIHADTPATVRLREVAVIALPFYNGQIMPGEAVARFAQAGPDAPWAAPLRVAVAPFEVPALDPETRRQVLLVVVLRVEAPDEGGITLRPVLTPRAPAAVPLHLPPARLAARRPVWVPRIAGPAPERIADAVLRLNQPSVLAMVALLDDTGPPVRAAARAWTEPFLAALAAPGGTRLAIATQKHMSEVSFRVSKARRSADLAEAAKDRLWPKLFDIESDLHTVTLGIVPPGGTHPIAGIALQAALRTDPARTADGLATVARFAPRPAAETTPPSGSTFAVVAWVLDAPEVFAQLGVTAAAMEGRFTSWLDGQAPIQGWIARTAWIPEFDLYEEYR